VKVALHACCGPCLIEPLDTLAGEHEVVVVFANPNIQPAAEYDLRRDTLSEWAEERGLTTVEVPYDSGLWEDAVADVRDEPGARCRRCYALRLGQVAAEGVRLGCEALSTTLSVSPYQDAEAIDEAGRKAAAAHGLIWLFEDYRPRYPEATRRSREAGMYRQNYCGCLPSKAEAEEDRARRRAERRRK
jgi:predicted adenine nucleotide alpha hydrolase (AANH) superfamily ATPase